MRILVVEDQKNLNKIVSEKMKKEGFAVDSCFDGDEVEDYLSCAEYDAVILDIMLPGTSGMDILRAMRSKGDKTPVLLLTALGSVENRIEGLNAGSDDYLVKPFDLEELTARVRAIIRRSGEQATNVLTVEDLCLDSAAKTVSRGGSEIKLTSKEFSILEYLMQNRGKVMTRSQILEHIWNYDYAGGSNVVDVYMHNIRKKVDGQAQEKRIHTVQGMGYTVR